MRSITISMLNRVKYALLTLLLFAVAFSSDTPKSTYTIPKSIWSVSSADIDLDGDMDILVGHRIQGQETNASFSILKNDGKGNFTIADTSKSFCGFQLNIFACKIDEDDYPDLITLYRDYQSGVGEEFIRIWYNENGNFNFYKDFSLNSTENISDITYGDVNGDGLIDILVMLNWEQKWGVLYNLGNGLLSSPEYHNVTGYKPLDIQCGDLNGDGRDDVVVVGQVIEIYYSRVSGFERKVLDSEAFKDKAAIVDFDMNGLMDIVADNAQVVNARWTNIYQNIGDENFIKLDDHFFYPRSSYFSLKDYNNDGLPDIAYVISAPYDTEIMDTFVGIEIFYNLGSFQLSEPHSIPLIYRGETGLLFYTADFDGNGYNDFVIARHRYNHLEHNLELLFNDGNGNFVDNPVGISEFSSKREKAMLRCYPNPFTEYINFEYKIKKTAMVELSVYDMQGKLIQCLTQQIKEGGSHSMRWHGLANGFIPEKPSVLIVCLKVNGEICQTIKIIKN